MRKYSLIALWILVECLASSVYAADTKTLDIGAESNCSQSITSSSDLFARVLRQFTIKPLFAQRDGQIKGSARRAAVGSIRITPHGDAVLTLARNIQFADGSPVSSQDLEYSIDRCVKTLGIAVDFEISEDAAKTMVMSNGAQLDLLRACHLWQAKSSLAFGDRFGINGLFVASGPYELEQLRKKIVSLVRMPDEGRGVEHVSITCESDPQKLISGVRSGGLSAAFVSGAATPILAGIGTGDETVFTKSCAQQSPNPYYLVSRNRSISCLEGLDPLAIIQ